MTAHYAVIENNQITNIIIADQDFIESGAMGDPANFIQVLDNNGVAKNHVGIGYTYNAELDAFIAPKPFDSWVLVNTAWTAPVDMPLDNKRYMWNEETTTWIEMLGALPEIL
jgi:hypothetical protein